MKNDYEIRGDVTAIIIRRKDGSVFESLIDTEDLESVIAIGGSWYLLKPSKRHNEYVVNRPYMPDGSRPNIRLHKFLIGEVPDGYVIDHINRDPKDNRRSNLRVVTQLVNTHNVDYTCKNVTGFRGVTKYGEGRFGANITFNNESTFLGVFETAEEAAYMYENKLKENRGNL